MDLVRPCIKCGRSDRYPSVGRHLGGCRPCKLAHTATKKAEKRAYDAAYHAINSAKKTADWKRRYQTDPQFRLAQVLRCRLGVSLKSGSAVRDLGCSVSDLKVYLEKQFQPGMTWANWSMDGWHIDHIVPLASFDLTDREQFLKACHYTNLQPLWAKDNLSKGARNGN